MQLGDEDPERQSAGPNSPTAAGAAAFIFQGDRNIYVNRAGELMTGYSAQELLQMRFWDVIHPDYRELIRQRGHARQQGEPVPWHYQVKLLRKNGETLWVEFSAGVIELGGQPAVLGTAIDITERRAAIERLRDNERWHRALIANSSDVVLVAGADLRLRYISPSMERLLGWRIDEMLDRDNLERVHPDDVGLVRGAYTELLKAAGHRAMATYRIRHRDGSWRWFESIGINLLHDPAVGGVIISSRDVTDRVEAETAYRNLVDHSLQGLVIFQDDRVVFANAVITGLTGYSVEEITGVGLERMRELVHPDDALAVRRTLRRGDGPQRAQFRLVRPDGGTRWVEAWAADTQYRGRPAFQVTYVDITERKRAEDEARRHQHALALVLRRRTLGEMAAIFAHEVNQPLTAILNYANGCTRRLARGELTDRSLQGALEEIAAQALRAGEVIRRLRSFVRKSDLQREPRQLNDVAAEAIAFVGPDAADHGVQLRIDLLPHLPAIEIDAVQIEQVILNLLRNALDAIYEHGGPSPTLGVSTRLVDAGVELAVTDSGAGIPDALTAEIFEPFVTSKPDGLGMGLTICRSIIEAHGGRIWVTPNADGGATFRFILPVMSDAAAAAR